MFPHTPIALAAIFCSIVTATAHVTQNPLFTLDAERVPGRNINTTYCTVPRSEQLFHVNFLEIQPTPIPV